MSEGNYNRLNDDDDGCVDDILYVLCICDKCVYVCVYR